ncbi:3'(2'),5'-bisphosphate nucleotidase CysQ [Desulfosporosinus nitroreducens]|uniref:3'(2'),5'-bisphosphate nucleotidase CysQ n=1 Tax=Desulfosporosinus nitroreducens TaxID=2018668 RepID=UPI00207CF6AE|nr:3'(2'),5'-bisphosphate nucleotidase CysQ [Desulfosporosinus nitroreducens]MCO1600968.1 3'(2'),5'-bisphosphate nucleotidase CysQ [Desulfosporosinus nitroreducens]
MKIQQILDKCKALAMEAGRVIIKVYATDFDVEMKNDKSPLTIADINANEIIAKGLKDNFSEYSILSEESRDDKSRLTTDYCFIVDPLDGTKEFVKRNGQFTVNIALAYRHKVIIGVIYVPVTGELYYASKDQGAYLEKIGYREYKAENTRLKVTDKTRNLIMVGSKSHSSEKEARLIEDNKDKIKEILSAGSSLKGCMVASGKADVYYRFGLTSEWDTAAMQCIVEEAGGIFRQMDGSEMLYNRENILNEKGFYVVNRRENIWV